MADVNPPRPYELGDPKELNRLYRECRGYLHTCHKKHGTDWEGRKFAMDALDTLALKSFDSSLLDEARVLIEKMWAYMEVSLDALRNDGEFEDYKGMDATSKEAKLWLTKHND